MLIEVLKKVEIENDRLTVAFLGDVAENSQFVIQDEVQGTITSTVFTQLLLIINKMMN